MTLRITVLAALGAATFLAATAPALADWDRDRGHGRWEEHRWHGDDRRRGGGYAPWAYSPPPAVYYAPAPAYVAPPPAVFFGFSLY